jgi:hypothetical protein
MSLAASGQGGLMVRVDPQDTDALLTKPHARPFEMRGSQLQGWLRIDAEGLRTSASSTRGSDAASRTPALFLPSAEVVQRHGTRVGRSGRPHHEVPVSPREALCKSKMRGRCAIPASREAAVVSATR